MRPPRPARPHVGTRLRTGAARLDLPLLAATLALCAIGGVSVYAATAHPLSGASSSVHYGKRVAVNVAIGLALTTLAYRVGVRRLRPLLPLLYLATLVLLLAVLTPVGATINGAHAWFKLGPVELEPNELAKIVVILFSAAILGDHHDRDTPPATDLIRVLAATALPLALVLAEPALGVAILIAALIPVLFAVAGAPTRWVAGLVSSAVLVVALALGLHLLKPYQEQRLTAFTHPAQNLSSTGYHTTESEIAIGDGGILGRGFLRGQQTNEGFVPEQQTDFVFAVAAEEGGFVTGMSIILLTGVVLFRGLRIARRAADLTDALVAAGIVTWFGLQAFVNIGMTMGIMPVTGLPLPFVSYGGSAMFADLFAVGLLLSIAREAQVSGPALAA